jgi:transcriptional regulator with XRE-family HTH domain
MRQSDVGAVSRSKVSRIERGLIATLTVGDLDLAAAAVGATLDIHLRWNGERLDRLMDEAHAHLVELVVRLLRVAGWDVEVEVSFSIWGERGSIDVFAYHRVSGIVLVMEVKSVVPDSQSMLHGLDRKTRLARKIAAERGWIVRDVARVLVIGDSPTSRRRVARLAATFDAAFPLRSVDVRRWLRQPTGPISGLLFLSFAQGMSANVAATARQRVRRRRLPHERGRLGPDAHGVRV